MGVFLQFMPTPFNTERPNSALLTHMERGMFSGQPRTPLYLHNSVARFVGRLLSFLFLDSDDCITTIVAEYAVEIVKKNSLYVMLI